MRDKTDAELARLLKPTDFGSALLSVYARHELERRAELGDINALLALQRTKYGKLNIQIVLKLNKSK